ncbi:ATP-binding protein [Sulfurospirillum barnesii]|uniref:p-loop ATPase, MinD superfamily n=1 Tax=Sulfurospirillum barnesii (strain ATCC 700032 / DSM 10660 / SES-3) TaxID=760154 RepID=I3XUB4_SULBS|nr:ATP-binding protein [Sulfurospirillum barnesii]AFL67538.1 P-loop ATPase, MinD superfamily [Sulfurospirillum barnesii SES-3]
MKIAIASGKGGTGKTTLSTNLATYLGETQRVVLVDLDVEEPNSNLFLNGELLRKEDKMKMIPRWDSTSCTLCAECVQNCNFNALLFIANEILVFQNLCHSCYACSELCPTGSLPMEPIKMGELSHFLAGDIEFVEGRLNIGEEQAVSLIAQTKKYVDQHFDDEAIKIFDSPPGTSCPVIEAIKDADFVILVTEPTPFGLHDLTLAVETTRILKKKFGVVINRYGMGNDEVEAYCQSENIPILGKIPHLMEAAKLYSEGKLIYKESPSFKDEIQNIALHVKNFSQGVEQ